MVPRADCDGAYAGGTRRTLCVRGVQARELMTLIRFLKRSNTIHKKERS